MHIRVMLFASLRERAGFAQQHLDVQTPLTAAQVWQQVCDFDMPSNTLIAINLDYVEAQTQVQEGDEVAFFPPVTGG